VTWGRTVEKIRVLVANRPRLMRDLVLATIADQPDIEVIGEMNGGVEIADVVAESKPDFVIIALDNPDLRPGICDRMFEENPHVKVIALAPERNSSILFWSVLDVRSMRIESSEKGILNALRGRAHVVVQ